MRAIHAIVGGVLLGAGIGWWALGHPGYETDAQHRARVVAAQEAATPRLYRWHDANGVLQLTSTPPKGRRYERVEMREDVNVVPMSPPSPAAAKKK